MTKFASEDLLMLTSMGFSKKRAKQALIDSEGDIDSAITKLESDGDSEEDHPKKRRVEVETETVESQEIESQESTKLKLIEQSKLDSVLGNELLSVSEKEQLLFLLEKLKNQITADRFLVQPMPTEENDDDEEEEEEDDDESTSDTDTSQPNNMDMNPESSKGNCSNNLILYKDEIVIEPKQEQNLNQNIVNQGEEFDSTKKQQFPLGDRAKNQYHYVIRLIPLDFLVSLINIMSESESDTNSSTDSVSWFKSLVRQFPVVGRWKKNSEEIHLDSISDWDQEFGCSTRIKKLQFQQQQLQPSCTINSLSESDSESQSIEIISHFNGRVIHVKNFLQGFALKEMMSQRQGQKVKQNLNHLKIQQNTQNTESKSNDTDNLTTATAAATEPESNFTYYPKESDIVKCVDKLERKLIKQRFSKSNKGKTSNNTISKRDDIITWIPTNQQSSRTENTKFNTSSSQISLLSYLASTLASFCSEKLLMSKKSLKKLDSEPRLSLLKDNLESDSDRIELTLPPKSMFAIYPSNGKARYAKHKDNEIITSSNTKSNSNPESYQQSDINKKLNCHWLNHRRVTAICYLSNKDSFKNHNINSDEATTNLGGHLVIYPPKDLTNHKGPDTIKITPKFGDAVFFCSRSVEHEVMPTKASTSSSIDSTESSRGNKSRVALSVWLGGVEMRDSIMIV